MSNFVHLHTHSHYSLLDGLSKIDELVAKTKELGMEAMALTDHGSLYGAVEFYKKTKAAGIKPILGIETYMAPRDRFSREPGEKYYHLILLAENETGWRNLIKLSTKAYLEGFYYKPRIDKEILKEHGEGLIGLSACMTGEINQALSKDNFTEAEKIAGEYLEILGKNNFFLEIGRHPNVPGNEKLNQNIIKLSEKTGIPLVATQDIHYTNPEDADYHDILLAVQTGSQLDDKERMSFKGEDFSVTSPEQMAEKFKDLPEAIENTTRIAERCNVKLELNKIHLPKFPIPDKKTADQYLRQLVDERTGERFAAGRQNEEFKKRLEYELGIIEKTGFADYFLIVQDLVNWAKDHGIAVGPGRGSSAGSLISYILRITDVDPLQYNLIFERFLNPDRIQMPDIDIDFADKRRDEVLSYAREKYGEDRVAQIITFGTMAARAAVRDAGRAMGLTYGFCDQIAKLIPFNLKMKDAVERVTDLNNIYKKDADAKKLLDAAKHLEGVARHASVHACGTVIAPEPLVNYVPLQFAPQDKTNVITQFEMHSIEDLGLLKIDLLGLRNLTIIEETVALVKELHGEEIKISEITLNDKKTFELLRRADTTGVFQLEGGGMRRYLKELKPTEIEDIIAMISLYRPGTLETGMVPKYIARKNGREKISYLHPKLEPILKKTYGIMLYQEQLMEVARELAGFTFSEADTLRKAVGKKIKSLLLEQKEKMVKGMIKNGIDQKKAEEIWSWFEPFARYGFNRSHAACYALIGYRTAYLKAHYPEEFMASLFNAEINDIERIAFLINESRQADMEVLPPDVNKSSFNFVPEGEKIRFGLMAIKNVGEQIARNIVEERIIRGPFKDLPDFLTRIHHKDLNKKSLESLIKSGALDSLGTERNKAFQNMEEILRFNTLIKKSRQTNNVSLFGSAGIGSSLKLKEIEPANNTEKLSWEKELLGIYLSDHPLNIYKEKIEKLKVTPIDHALSPQNEGRLVKIAGIVSEIKKVFTKTGQPMLFAKAEDFSKKPIEITVFNNTLNRTLDVWKESNVIVVQGRITRRNGEMKMIAEAAAVLKIS